MLITLIDDHQIIIDGYKAILLANGISSEDQIFSINSLEDAVSFVYSSLEQKTKVDLFIIDYNMPSDSKQKVKNGLDLALLIKSLMPDSKIVLLTSNDTPIVLYQIISQLNPSGLWLKTDLGYLAFLEYINIVLSGASVFSQSVKKSYENVKKFTNVLDDYDYKMLLLLKEGVKTKNLPNYIPLSLGTLNHRKSNLKIVLGIENGDDDEIVKKAQSLGLL
jgi:two-component system response regulator NreC